MLIRKNADSKKNHNEYAFDVQNSMIASIWNESVGQENTHDREKN